MRFNVAWMPLALLLMAMLASCAARLPKVQPIEVVAGQRTSPKLPDPPPALLEPVRCPSWMTAIC